MKPMMREVRSSDDVFERLSCIVEGVEEALAAAQRRARWHFIAGWVSGVVGTYLAAVVAS